MTRRDAWALVKKLEDAIDWRDYTTSDRATGLYTRAQQREAEGDVRLARDAVIAAMIGTG